MNNVPRRRRRRFLQYGLRTLLGLMLLVAALAALYRSYVHPRILQQEATIPLAKKGASLEWQPAKPAWLQRTLAPIVGNDVLRDCVAIHAEHSDVEDDDLRFVRRLPRLERLYLAGTSVTDAGLEHLRGLEGLQRLSLWRTKITDKGFAHLADLHALEALDAHGNGSKDGVKHLKDLTNLQLLRYGPRRPVRTGDILPVGDLLPVDDEGLDVLAGMPRLYVQSLLLEGVTDAGLAALPSIPTVEIVRVHESQITDEGLRYFAALRNLKHVSFYKTPVKGPGLRYLRQLPMLQTLALQETSITNDGLSCLSQLANVHHLDLRNTAVTTDCLRHIVGMQRLEQLHIEFPLDDHAVRCLTHLPNLQNISGERSSQRPVCYLTDAGLADLAKLNFLTGASLHDACDGRDIDGIDVPPHSERMTDVGLAKLWQSPHLEGVDIHGRDVTLASLVEVPTESRLSRAIFHFSSPLDETTFSGVGNRVSTVEFRSNLLGMQLAPPHRPRTISALFHKGRLDLGLLAQMPNLKILRLPDDDVPCSWDNLRFVPQLVQFEPPLYSKSMAIDVVAVLGLSQMKNLQILQCSLADGLRPEQLLPLGTLSKLQTVNLACSEFSGEHCRFLAGLTNLRTLRIFAKNGKICDGDGLQYIAGCRQLQELEVDGCTDACLQHIRKLRNLHSLVISGDVTDEGLKHLLDLPALYVVDGSRTKITSRGIAEFKKLHSPTRRLRIFGKDNSR